MGRFPHSSYLAGKLLYDLWRVSHLRRLLVQRHHHKELKQPLLLKLYQIPLQSLVVRVPLGGWLHLQQAPVSA